MSWFNRFKKTQLPKQVSLDTFYTFYEGELYKQLKININNPPVKEKFQSILQEITESHQTYTKIKQRRTISPKLILRLYLIHINYIRAKLNHPNLVHEATNELLANMKKDLTSIFDTISIDCKKIQGEYGQCNGSTSIGGTTRASDSGNYSTNQHINPPVGGRKSKRNNRKYKRNHTKSKKSNTKSKKRGKSKKTRKL